MSEWYDDSRDIWFPWALDWSHLDIVTDSEKNKEKKVMDYC